MVQFAEDDDIDATLHDIKAALETGAYSKGEEEAGTLTWEKDADWNQATHLSYSTNDAVLEYAPISEEYPNVLSYDEGWGRLSIRQCLDPVSYTHLDVYKRQALFGADHANVQPHSGASANYAVYQALCNVGDTVMGMNLDNGGHLTHGSPVNYSGINYKIVPYGVDPKTHRIDYDQVRDLAKQCKPKMIIAGASAYPRIIDFKAFREIADEVGALSLIHI